MHNIIGTARRVTQDEAREHFEAGGRVCVSVNGQTEFDVTPSTTTNHKSGMTWEELARTVWSYGDSRQRYYAVTFTHAPESVLSEARRLGTIAYNLGHPNTPNAFRGVYTLTANLNSAPAGEVVAAFSEAWEDNAEHDRQTQARKDAERQAVSA